MNIELNKKEIKYLKEVLKKELRDYYSGDGLSPFSDKVSIRKLRVIERSAQDIFDKIRGIK